MSTFAKRWSTEAMDNTSAIMSNLVNSMGDPDTISFGGGSPAKEALPIDILREIANDVLHTDRRGIEALAYGTSMGARDLREIIARDLLAPKGVNSSADNIMVCSGGLETMNLMCQLFIEPGDVILVESPTFVHCVMIFQMFEAVCIPCEMDDSGLIMEDVEEKIKKYNPKIIYTIPTFQNPTGVTLSQNRRKKLAELAAQYDVIVLEDDPYRDIRYSGKELLPIKAFDETGHVVLANSFSKILSPGSRLGYVLANDKIITRMADAKMATNTHTGMISEVLCAEFFKRGYFPGHLAKICDIYRERRDVMMECIDTYFPHATKHTYPDGGLFTWAELPEDINTTDLLKESMEKCNVAFVAGESFFVESNGKGSNCMRISFGGVHPEKIREGMKRLGSLISSKF